MRTVSVCQIISSEPGSFEIANTIVENWAASKFDESGPVPIIRHSGRDALFTRVETEAPQGHRVVFQTEEEVEGGSLRTAFTLLKTADGVAMLCVQSMLSNALVAPGVRLALPRFVGDIIRACPGCTASHHGDRLFRQVFNVNDRSLDEFGQLIFSPTRVLPVVAISVLNGQPLTRDFPDRLADRIAGLAHICLLSSEASWQLTEKFGKEWSVYNGAVKVYWPGAQETQSGKRHPLWTYDRLAERHKTDREAASWLEQRLLELVFEASSFMVEDRGFAAFDQAQHAAQIRDQMAAAEDASSFRQLAETYLKDSDELRLKISELNEEIGGLKAKLRAAYGSYSAAAENAVDDTEEPPPSTVQEALDAAMRRFSEELAFPDDVQGTVADLNSSAGPPEKILRYLEVLAEYARTSRAGSLGKSVEKWLEDRGVICSGESPTIANNKKEQELRTWSVNGKRLTFDLHLKPNDGTSPDRCVRIYFAPLSGGKVPVGYIGRHF